MYTYKCILSRENLRENKSFARQIFAEKNEYSKSLSSQKFIPSKYTLFSFFIIYNINNKKVNKHDR